MASMLAKRGPDRSGTSLERHVGLGHTLLATTPESLFEPQPFTHPHTGCVIVADVRLDNRDELLDALNLGEQRETTGDAELILRGYLAWGEQCLDRLLGDFAFAIWDPRHQRLFCARDHFGMRPLYYYHAPGKLFLFASDARAILVLPQVPYKINEARVADFLVPQLEWIDYTSTFYEGISRLPPGHKAMVTPSRLEVTEYWRSAPAPDPGPMSDEDYAEGFLEVFTQAVDSRLRAPEGKVGSMLSGGMDSGSVVAVGKDVLAGRGGGPLPTYSGVLYRDSDCAESRAIYAAIAMPSIAPLLVHPDGQQDLYEWMTSNIEEPFDGPFTILKAVYQAARNNGQNVVLDGAGGDVVLGEGTYIARLLRHGRFSLALSEIRGETRFWGRSSMCVGPFCTHARAALVPEFVKKPIRPYISRSRNRSYVKESLISDEFAAHVDMDRRFEQMQQTFERGQTQDYATERCKSILPNMTAGRERYARLASAASVEARDPFLDKRLVDFCSLLPGHIRMEDGWPKMILRKLMADRLPDEVRWAREKPHIGWQFNSHLVKQAVARGDLRVDRLQKDLRGYVNSDSLASAWQKFSQLNDFEPIYYAFVLSNWLRESETRPVVRL